MKGLLPTEVIRPQALTRFVRKFIALESAGGILMIVAAIAAMLAANGSMMVLYQEFVELPIVVGLGDNAYLFTLKEFVKDVLMVLFFLIVGLELKREAKEGFLNDKAQILLPMAAAAGGMAAPAIIYFLFNYPHPELWAGWAIPSATDIAFALCVLMLAGKGVPASIKIFLLAIAIFDDIGAILIIAFFYSGAIAPIGLLLSLMGVGVLWALNKNNVQSIAPYILTGVYLWFALHYAGIHTTVAGVLAGLFMPMRCDDDPNYSTVNSAIHFLHPWVSFGVLPLFAFVSAGVPFEGMEIGTLFNPLPLGIALALFFGKQIGILGATWGMFRLSLAKLPESANWLHVYGVSVIAGIGFTMSLFIGLLAFDDPMLQNELKLGVIAGSLLSTVWGAIVFRLAAAREQKAQAA